MPSLILQKFLPNEVAYQWVLNWIAPYSVEIKITKARKGKLGDYRMQKKQFVHKITINSNLPKELFFLTLTHEIAHMMIYENHSRHSVKPHGKEWKNRYAKMIQQSINAYSESLQPILLQFSQKPKAGYYSDSNIVQYFHLNESNSLCLLMNLNEGNYFSIENIPYQLLHKRRTRYLCKNLQNQKKYLINRSVSVEKIQQNG